MTLWVTSLQHGAPRRGCERPRLRGVRVCSVKLAWRGLYHRWPCAGVLFGALGDIWGYRLPVQPNHVVVARLELPAGSPGRVALARLALGGVFAPESLGCTSK